MYHRYAGRIQSIMNDCVGRVTLPHTKRVPRTWREVCVIKTRGLIDEAVAGDE